MKLAIILLTIFPAIILGIFGVFLKMKKAYWLISGYNKLTEEQKEKVHVEKISKLLGNTCLIMAAIILVGSALIYFDQISYSIVCFVLVIPISIISIFSMQKYIEK